MAKNKQQDNAPMGRFAAPVGPKVALPHPADNTDQVKPHTPMRADFVLPDGTVDEKELAAAGKKVEYGHGAGFNEYGYKVVDK